MIAKTPRLRPGTCLLLIFGYLGLALMSLYLSRQGPGVASIWLANALAIAVLFSHPRRHWLVLLPCMALGNLAAELLFGDSLAISLFFTGVNLLEVSLAACLLQRATSATRQMQDNPLALLRTLGNGAVWPVLLSASLGAFGLSQLQLGHYVDLWLIWFASSCTGSVALLPLMLIWRQRGLADLLGDFHPLLTPTLLLGCLSLGILALLYLPFPFVYLGAPLLLATFYLSLANIALFNACLAMLVSGMLSLGLFIPPPLTASWQAMLLYLPILAVLMPPLLLSASLQQARQRELDFRISEQRFRGALAFAGTGVALASSDGLITEANQRLCQLFGYRREELLGTQHLDLSHPDDRNLSRERLDELLAGKCDFYALDKRFLNSHGQPFWAHVTVSRLPRQNDADELIVQIDDISDKVEAQHKLNQLRIVAEKANRTKSEFLANMSHEIRTPMNGVLGIAQLLERTELNSTQRKYLDMLHDAGKSLLAVINDILDFAKIEAGRLHLSPCEFELDELVSHMASLMTLQAGERDLELLIQVDPQVPGRLFADRNRLQQILANLTGNAIKFTPHGEVELSIGIRQQDNRSLLHFRVRDTGIGIGAQQQASLFEALESSEPVRTPPSGGSGLGLAISKRLVQLMGGELGLHSAANQGSEFWFDLPLKQPLPSSVTALPEIAALAGLRVLLVEDHPRCRQILWQQLCAYRCSVDCAGSCADAEVLFEQALMAGQPYQLLLIDWQMPGANGLQTLERLREHAPKAMPPCLLMVNAFAREHLTGTDTQPPVTSLLLKPVTRSSLQRQMLEALQHPQSLLADELLREQQPLQGSHLLLVEDNTLNQIVAQGILEKMGAQVSVASDGQQALERLRQTNQPFDLVLMDIQMPGMDGLTATRMIRDELGLQLPVLAMTAGVSPREREQCREAGMNAFIAKPIEQHLLLKSLLPYLSHRPVSPGDTAVAIAQPSAVFNADNLQRLCAASPDVHLTMAGLIAAAIERGLQPLEEIREAWHNGQHDEASRLLHTQRGSLATLGAVGVPALCLRLEDSIRLQQADRIEPLLAELDSEFRALLDALQQWLRDHPPGKA